jgi:hypothetical protein
MNKVQGQINHYKIEDFYLCLQLRMVLEKVLKRFLTSFKSGVPYLDSGHNISSQLFRVNVPTSIEYLNPLSSFDGIFVLRLVQ